MSLRESACLSKSTKIWFVQRTRVCRVFRAHSECAWAHAVKIVTPSTCTTVCKYSTRQVPKTCFFATMKQYANDGRIVRSAYSWWCTYCCFLNRQETSSKPSKHTFSLHWNSVPVQDGLHFRSVSGLSAFVFWTDKIAGCDQNHVHSTTFESAYIGKDGCRILTFPCARTCFRSLFLSSQCIPPGQMVIIQ